MRARLAVVLSIAAVLAAGCGTAVTPEEWKAAGGLRRPAPFEAWALSNGTGAFFAPVGPGGGAGVRFAWPQ